MGRLRVAVLGAGNIGCQVGGQLAAAADVTLIGRPRVLDAIAADGLRLTAPGTKPAVVTADRLVLATTPDAAVDAHYVLVAVKSAATEPAVRELAAHLSPDAVVVSLQNGLRNTEVIQALLPDHTVLAGMVAYNVVQTGPASFHRATSGEVMVQECPQSAALVEAGRAAGLRISARPDMREVQHAKLLMNLNNAVNALSGMPLGDELSRRGYRKVLALCQEEALAAFAAEGVMPAQLGPVPPSVTPRLLRAPDQVFRVLSSRSLKVDPQARSSTWDDLCLGRGTEIDELQGAVVALAGRHGIPAPANQRLVELVHQAEADGPAQLPHWAAADLLAAVTSG